MDQSCRYMRNFCLKRPDGVLVRIVVYPTCDAFDHYVIVEEAGAIKFKLWVCTLEVDAVAAGTDLLKAKWKTDNELVLSIPSKNMVISVYMNECRATVRQQAKPFISPFELSSGRPLAESYLAM